MSDNPLIVEVQSSTSWYSGSGLVEDALQVSNGIENGSWADVTLGGLGGGLEALAVAIDPLGTLASWGVGWLLEHVQPLQDALNQIAGDPDAIAAQAAAWRNVSAAMADAGQRYAADVETRTAEWFGLSGDTYRAHAAEQSAAMEAITIVTRAIAFAVEGAGLLVGAVRGIVNDLIAQFVATLMVRLPQWLAVEGVTLGIATPAVVSQVATMVAHWASRIRGFLQALLDSLRRLNGRLTEINVILDRLRQRLGRLSRTSPVAAETNFFSKNPVRSNQDVLDHGPGTPMSRDNVDATAQRMNLDLTDVDVVLITDAEEIRYLDYMDASAYTPGELHGAQVRLGPASFADGETLAATIAHEYTHVLQQRRGEHLHRLLRELEDEAYASEIPALERWRSSPT
ncbi:DUF4157 domain-containing protein [Actinoplanes sp. NBRC 101535]|uniref:eCIS core domain-containing protein n=1 Tax=Actinoplanes sp. NBRC 101535 TaxID=3032196 RepID=UPI0024A43674|nr:DUF4157 domain-containing protein [Actinoplanes sp. NBRC 101535]GLY01585.1 hypothetical protein Acsp01_19640 [Actinoplanes sp. NBRC 101535]